MTDKIKGRLKLAKRIAKGEIHIMASDMGHVERDNEIIGENIRRHIRGISTCKSCDKNYSIGLAT